METDMSSDLSGRDQLDPRTRTFYCAVLTTLRDARVPFLVGGGYALDYYTGLGRGTKDFDLYVCPHDLNRALALLSRAGYKAERTFHWIGKVWWGEDLVDIIYSGLNGVPTVDETWFEHAVAAEILGVPVKLCPPEELIWSKAFVMERERYDGADVLHLLRSCGERLDWPHLLRRFDRHWQVLLSHLILFGFVYPAERSHVPDWVMHELLGRLQVELLATGQSAPPTGKVCQGTLLSWRQYLPDVERWGYQDARIVQGYMTPEQIAAWTAAFRET
jgi:Nucleotidyl transferase of unknown function (DUF2204)